MSASFPGSIGGTGRHRPYERVRTGRDLIRSGPPAALDVASSFAVGGDRGSFPARARSHPGVQQECPPCAMQRRPVGGPPSMLHPSEGPSAHCWSGIGRSRRRSQQAVRLTLVVQPSRTTPGGAPCLASSWRPLGRRRWSTRSLSPTDLSASAVVVPTRCGCWWPTRRS